MHPEVEIRIPMSPSEQFFRMLRYFLESLQEFGGPIGKAARCVVSLSRDHPRQDPRLLHSWLDRHSVTFRWIDELAFARWEYDATGFDRFYVESDADVVVMADADLLVSGDFDEVLVRAHDKQLHLGFIAHVSPFQVQSLASRFWPFSKSSRYWWERIYDAAGLPPPELNREHTGWGLMTRNPKQRYCPNYFNYGVLVAPRVHFEAIGRGFVNDLETIERIIPTPFKSQIAHTIGIDRNDIDCELLSINYNFPLHTDEVKIRELNPDPTLGDDAESIKIFHYLGHGEINKRHFLTEQSFQRLMERKRLSRSASLFQRKLQRVSARISSNADRSGSGGESW